MTTGRKGGEFTLEAVCWAALSQRALLLRGEGGVRAKDGASSCIAADRQKKGGALAMLSS